MPDIFDQLAASQGNAPAPTGEGDIFDQLSKSQGNESLTPETDKAASETFGDRVKNFFFTKEGAETLRSSIQGAVKAVPQMAVDTAKTAWDAVKFRNAPPDEQAR